jgi:hypothetical protein
VSVTDPNFPWRKYSPASHDPFGHERCSLVHKPAPPRTPGAAPQVAGRLAAQGYTLSAVEEVITGQRKADKVYDEQAAASGKE